MPGIQPFLRLSVLGGLLGMSACAPATTGPVAGAAHTVLDAQETAQICAAAPRVTDRGVLLYGPDSAESSLPPEYELTCPDLSIHAQGLDVSVTAPTLERALATFDARAFMLTYFADLGVHVQGTTVTADDPSGVPEVLLDDVQAVTVTVQPDGGAATPLVQGGRTSPVTVPPGVPLTIRIQAGRSPVAWPTVRLDPHGTVVATMAR